MFRPPPVPALPRAVRPNAPVVTAAGHAGDGHRAATPGRGVRRSRATATRWRLTLAFLLCLGAAGCETGTARPTPEQVRATLLRAIPRDVPDRTAWAADIQSAFFALDIDPSAQNLCATLAVIEQESTYRADPDVPGLGRIAVEEIERRAAAKKIPAFAIRALLRLDSPNGEPWGTRLQRVRTERELSELYEEMIAQVPLGTRLLARANPVRTGGAMQVSIAFAEAHARQRRYPYAVEGSIRREVFTRRGGTYFGIAHLLGYPASYDKPLFRFADFNAGLYASRNAAFQNAVAVASGIPLDLDGDLVRYGKRGSSAEPSATELAVRRLLADSGMSEERIRTDLRQGRSRRFEDTETWQRVFAIGDRRNGRSLPRATLPRIALKSPKITRSLTTEWFATRVNRRYTACMKKIGD